MDFPHGNALTRTPPCNSPDRLPDLAACLLSAWRLENGRDSSPYSEFPLGAVIAKVASILRGTSQHGRQQPRSRLY
jgi:hypothetical protein